MQNSGQYSQSGSEEDWEQLVLTHPAGTEIALIECNPVAEGPLGAEDIFETIKQAIWNELGQGRVLNEDGYDILWHSSMLFQAPGGRQFSKTVHESPLRWNSETGNNGRHSFAVKFQLSKPEIISSI